MICWRCGNVSDGKCHHVSTNYVTPAIASRDSGAAILFRLRGPNPHFSPGSREQAQDSCYKAPLWSEKRSESYGLSEEQAYGHEGQPEP